MWAQPRTRPPPQRWGPRAWASSAREFCFLERDTEPNVEKQAVAHQGVFDAFPGKNVVLRTPDAGADKPPPFLTPATEPSPALGILGYRTDFTNPGVLERRL